MGIAFGFAAVVVLAGIILVLRNTASMRFVLNISRSAFSAWLNADDRHLVIRGGIAFFALKLDGPVEQLAFAQVVDDQLEQVDMGDFQVRAHLREMRDHELQVLAYFQFVLGGVVENIETDLIAEARAAQHVLILQPGDDLVQSILQFLVHGRRLMHCRA